MALVIANRVYETSSTTGTGTLTLNGAVTGYQTFQDALGDLADTYYTITDQVGGDWEVGIGYTDGSTLVRVTVLSSSNAGDLVDFTGDTFVWVDYPAEKAVNLDENGNVTALGTINSGTWNATTISVPHGGTGLTSLDTDHIPYGNSTSAYQSSQYLTFNGTTLRVGTAAPLGGATNPIVVSTGAANGYVQTYIYNATNGGSSSADFAAYPSNGNDASGWIDMGITSLAYNDATYPTTGPNEGYLFMSAPSGSGTSGNLVYATDSTGTTNSHQWYVGGFNQAKGSWKMQLTSTGLQLADALAVSYGGTGSGTASGARTNLGATTLGSNIFTITNPSAITFPRFNADNTVSALSASDFRTAIGAGTGAGTVTSVGGTGTVNGITLTGTVTSSGNLTLGGTLSGIGNAQLTNSSVTVNGTAISLGASGTITAATTNALTIGSGLSGTSFDGSAAVTITNSSPMTYPSGSGIAVVASGTSWGSTVAAPSGTIVGTSDTQTLTNKRITSRITSITGTSGGTITPASDTSDQYNITALGATADFAAPSGTPTDGQKLTIRIYSAAAQSITSWASGSGGYREIGTTLPTTTGVGKTIYVGCIYNGADTIWDVVSVATQA